MVLEQLLVSLTPTETGTIGKLSESVQPGNVDTVSVSRGWFRNVDHL